MTVDPDPGSLGTTEVADEPTRLVHQYQEESTFFLASPRQTLLARGIEATVPKMGCSRGSWPVSERVAEFFDNALDFGRRDPVVVGAVPFDHNLPAHLVLPGEIRRAGPLDRRPPPETGCRSARADQWEPEWTVRGTPGPVEYERGIRRVLPRLERGELDSVMLGRCLEIAAQSPIDPARTLRQIAADASGGCSFAVALPRRGEDGTRDSYGPHPALERTLVGSGPDLLVSRRGTQVIANPTAGSLPRGRDQAEDSERAAQLLASQRHRREHALEVASVADALRPLCHDLHVPEEPGLTASATAWHLRTEIIAELREPAISSITVAMAVHPGSSVCGSPAGAAGTATAETEPFQRGYAAGLVGWCDAAGDGDWISATQCAEIEDATARLFGGSGIVRGCDPRAETEATSAHLRTAMAALRESTESRYI